MDREATHRRSEGKHNGIPELCTEVFISQYLNGTDAFIREWHKIRPRFGLSPSQILVSYRPRRTHQYIGFGILGFGVQSCISNEP